MQKHFLFLSSFEHENFAINAKYSKKHYDNPNYYASFLIFQIYKNVVLRSVDVVMIKGLKDCVDMPKILDLVSLNNYYKNCKH
jgi:hypothetical protein